MVPYAKYESFVIKSNKSVMICFMDYNNFLLVHYWVFFSFFFSLFRCNFVNVTNYPRHKLIRSIQS